MSRVLKHLSLVPALLSAPLCAKAQSQDAQAKSLVFRLTSDDAMSLRAFLQERMPQKIDFARIKYFGDLNSLACSERNDCFLWLTRLEWRQMPEAEGQETQLVFTLPFRETVLSGQLSLQVLPTGERDVSLQVQDRSLRPGTWALQPKTCAATNPPQKTPLLKPGECRLEFSNAVKNLLSYAPSVQFIQNADSIVVSFAGTSAQQLFESRPDEVDPVNDQWRRVQLGSKSYCWNQEPALPAGAKPEAYVCQASYEPRGDLDFVDPSTGLSLQFHFSSDIAQNVSVGRDSVPVGTCPVSTKVGTDLRCNVYYNWKGKVDAYPIGNAVQGVAVGWGVAAS